jgi:hypothetical protein
MTMKHIFSLSLFFFSAVALVNPFEVFAQKETYDLVSYTAPKGWKNEVLTNSTNYIITNNANNSWCQIRIIKSSASKGNIDRDFQSEWQELIVPNYKPTGAPQVIKTEQSDGWKIKTGGGKFIFNNSNAMVTLTTMSGYNRCVSIVTITNSQDYVKDIDALLASVKLKKPETINQQTSGANEDNNSITGIWIATASDQSSFRMNNGVMNYISRQYTFNTNGTYTFFSKAFDPLMDKILLGKENGTYQVSGTTITITPQKSVLEAWSKKNGVDDWGRLLTSQNRPLEKQNYQFVKHYFSGMKEWDLVFQANKQTQRDGPFSGGTAFNNAWIYSPISNYHPLIKLPN